MNAWAWNCVSACVLNGIQGLFHQPPKHCSQEVLSLELNIKIMEDVVFVWEKMERKLQKNQVIGTLISEMTA